MLRAGEASSVALTERMLERIDQYNPRLNAYITITAELARAQARESDRELGEGRDRGPLHGIPVAVKDLFATRGVRTTCGSRLFADWVPDYDAAAVTRLREAGAVMLGKTGLHELAYGASSINAFFGAVRNPWNTACDPGGSSGGSAAAVAAGLAYAALGSDTGCSIRQPAHCCGIVGHKPTFGAVSKAGAFPLVWSMDHVGPLTRTVGDAVAMLEALVGPDPADPYSNATKLRVPFEPARAVLSGKRLGVIRRFFFDGHDDVIEVVDAALDRLRASGAELVELDVPDIEDAFAAAGTTFAEASAVHEADLIERADGFSDELRGKLEAGLSVRATRYIRAQQFRRGFTTRMERLLDQCDALVAPTATVAAAPIDRRPEDYGRHAWKNTGIFDFTGQPSVSVPCGFTGAGMPVGLMITGSLFDDGRVLEIAHAYEQAAGWYGRFPAL